MGYKLYSNITFPNPTEEVTGNTKELECSLLKDVLNVKHCTT